MSMTGSSMGNSLPAAHKPTLGYAIGGFVVLIIIYHFALGKK